MATLLFRKPPRVVEAPVHPRVAIIDIGSNSVRLVVYEGPPRLPATLFNEKVMAGLGRGLAETGAIAADAMALAQAALARFAWLAREMQVTELRVVATAAVRDASNGGDLIAAATAMGLQVELLSGEEEATAAGYGVLSALPDADGIVGDLGGGSLELVRISGGQVREQVSFPLGVLRIAGIRAKGKDALDRHIAAELLRVGWIGRGVGLPLYLVGGSWRSLARLDMHLSGYPLPVIHDYAMTVETVMRIRRTLAHISRGKLRSIANLSSARIPTLGDGAALLSSLMRQLGTTHSVASAFGLREGLLYARLSEAERAEDPLIVAAREEGRRLGRFAEHGDLLDRWIAPLFADEPPDVARLRHAACLLADVGWHANPEFRAERGLEIALHGDWVAIDARGRAILAQALFTCLGGGIESPEPLGQLADAATLQQAKNWGLAMRLGQRMSGGVAQPLARTRIEIVGDRVLLHADPADRALYGEAVERRHKALASMLGLTARWVV